MASYKQQVLHVDFQRVDKDHKIHVKVPQLSNADVAPGVKTRRPHHIVRTDAVPASIARVHEVDRGGEVGHSIHANDLALPAGVGWSPVKQETLPWRRSMRPRAVLPEAPVAAVRWMRNLRAARSA
jgi:large subunit ribosomal protein L25